MLYDILFWTAYLALWAAAVRYDIHMFQHNSYHIERYARWYRSGHKFLRSGMIALMAVILSLGFIPREIAISIASALMLCIAWREFSTPYKKPLVYTMRIKRLIISSALLTIATVAAALYFLPEYAAAFALAILVLPMVMLGANLLNKPLEAAVGTTTTPSAYSALCPTLKSSVSRAALARHQQSTTSTAYSQRDITY